MEPVQQSVSKSASRVTGKAPEFKLGPELPKHLIFTYEAFWDLDSERINAFDRGRIPWHSIVAYAAFYELDEMQTDALIEHIKGMDLAYLRKLREMSDAKKGK